MLKRIGKTKRENKNELQKLKRKKKDNKIKNKKQGKALFFYIFF